MKKISVALCILPMWCIAQETMKVCDDGRLPYSGGVRLTIIKPVAITAPLLSLDGPTTYKLSRKDINRMAATDVRDMISIFPGVYQKQRGTDVSIGGSRNDGTLYIIDGVQIARR